MSLSHVRAHAPFTWRKLEYDKDGGLVMYGSMRDHLPYVVVSRHGHSYLYCATEKKAREKADELNYMAALKVMTDE